MALTLIAIKKLYLSLFSSNEFVVYRARQNIRCTVCDGFCDRFPSWDTVRHYYCWYERIKWPLLALSPSLDRPLQKCGSYTTFSFLPLSPYDSRIHPTLNKWNSCFRPLTGKWPWIGFRDLGNNDTYFWTNGRMVDPAVFPWYQGTHPHYYTDRRLRGSAVICSRFRKMYITSFDFSRTVWRRLFRSIGYVWRFM